MMEPIMKKMPLEKGVRDKVYKNSFEDLEENTVYWDPMGWRLGRPVNMRKEWYERDKDVFQEIDQLTQKGMTLNRAVTETSMKSMDTDAWGIPVHYVRDVFTVNPERTPMADLIARETIVSDTIETTHQTGEVDPTFADEPTTYTQESSMNDYFETNSYDITFYGYSRYITDKMNLASRAIRSAESAVEQLDLKSMRYAEEKQIFYGAEEYGGGTAETRYGFEDGFTGLVKVKLDEDSNTDAEDSAFDDIIPTEISKSDVRALIHEVEKNGADKDNIGIFTNFTAFRTLADELDDYSRYMDLADDYDFGFKTLHFDGVPIMKSTGIQDFDAATTDNTNYETIPYVFAVNMNSVFMGMLRDVTMTPLAKDATVEKAAVDAYGALAAEHGDHIEYIVDNGDTS